MSVHKSDIEIPAEWIENIEKSHKKIDEDAPKHKEFILKYHEFYSVNAIAKAIGKSRSYVDNKINELKNEGRL